MDRRTFLATLKRWFTGTVDEGCTAAALALFGPRLARAKGCGMAQVAGKNRVGRFRRLALALGLIAAAPALLATSDPTGNFATRVLAAHNRERAALDIQPLRWNPKLAADAAVWGRHLVKVGRLVHYQEAPDDIDPQGENLWAGTKGHYGLEAMVGLWVAEKKNFRAGVFPANSRTGDLEDIGHYTQLIWRSSGEVGCALVRGEQDDFFVCRYAEGGNVLGEAPF